VRFLTVFLLMLPAAQAAVEGVVLNLTTGKPQPAATVTLFNLGGAGMDPVASVKTDAQGAFRFEQDLHGPRLLQAAVDGVTYSHMLPQGAPSTGLRLEVYSATSKAGGAKVIQHMVLLEPAGGQLRVSESILFRNDGKTTFHHPDKGTLRVYLPAEAEETARVTATAPQGLPVERSAEKTSEQNVYKIDYPVKPGETRIDLAYGLPFTVPGSFQGRAMHGGGPLRLVAPPGVSLRGDGITAAGQEPSTQASVYEVSGTSYKVEIDGTGALSAAAPAEEEGGEGLRPIRARIYDRLSWILGLSAAILMLGFLLLYRRGSASAAPPSERGARR